MSESIGWRLAAHPYLPAAREAVADLDVRIDKLVERDHAAPVDRARDRVLATIDAGGIGEPAHDARTELLAYPLTRVLVSLVDDRALTERYVRAEATAAREQLEASDDSDLASTSGAGLDDILPALGLADAVDRPAGSPPRVALGAYLDLVTARDTSIDAEWSLAARPLSDGWVHLDAADELYPLVERAIERQIADGLPVDVPMPVADALAAEVATIRERLTPPDPPEAAPDALTDCRYPCPACRSTTVFHTPDCRFGECDREQIQQAYVAIATVLDAGPRDRDALQAALDDWGPLYAAVVDALERDHRIEARDDGALAVVPPAERRERLRVPQHEALRTIYDEGSVPGAHDNSVFALVSYYEMVGLSWPETREAVLEWLDQSGTWERGGFEEATPEDLVDAKRHVYEQGYGWKAKAEAASRVITQTTLRGE